MNMPAESVDQIVEAVEQIKDCPCDKCPKAQYCAESDSCCSQWRLWSNLDPIDLDRRGELMVELSAYYRVEQVRERSYSEPATDARTRRRRRIAAAKTLKELEENVQPITPMPGAKDLDNYLKILSEEK